MSKDLQEAIKIMRDMTPIIDPEEDYLTILAAEEQVATTEARRKKELEDTQLKLKVLTKALEAARVSSTRPPSIPSTEDHAAIINQLDVNRLSLCKAINECESLLAGKEAELANLKAETKALEDCDPAAEHANGLNSAVVRMQLYKGLGFEPVLNNDQQLAKMLVHSESGDIHYVEFDGKKSDFEYVDLMWRLAST